MTEKNLRFAKLLVLVNAAVPGLLLAIVITMSAPRLPDEKAMDLANAHRIAPP